MTSTPSDPVPEGALTLLVAVNGRTEQITFFPAERPDLYEKWKLLVDAHVRAKQIEDYL